MHQYSEATAKHMVSWSIGTRASIAAICQRYGIRRLEVFGSAARGMPDGGAIRYDLKAPLD
ncbi:MAG: hypothetical protein U1D25_08705 [Hydrogenophaga sp.]|uniref:hypothetical protein n=1 Tax=Hydrogenophaga sp. TaxID=1904254 RepID=UPI0027754693|nr:hypothetical protein [Hydrogenophaga sp.]MDP2418202.1 hypothetical protein [Hydrogenophaga sp.]MDZ4188170.1 hypothetical protein [Hydrogenophaga sp.]